MAKVQIEESWLSLLSDCFEQPYFQEIVHFIKTEKEAKKTIYPPGPQIFRAFNACPVQQVKLVILGQDPYHGVAQANGLCFSVSQGVATPPSLQNIFKELQSDIGMPIPKHGDLESWSRQGVFLLNAILTVRANEPTSHSKIGWMSFTDEVIKRISEKRQHLVFLLWGKFAQEKAKFIDEKKHLILKAAHPSPLSAHNGFWGCKHFSKANEYLVSKGIEPINWHI